MTSRRCVPGRVDSAKKTCIPLGCTTGATKHRIAVHSPPPLAPTSSVLVGYCHQILTAQFLPFDFHAQYLIVQLLAVKLFPLNLN